MDRDERDGAVSEPPGNQPGSGPQPVTPGADAPWWTEPGSGAGQHAAPGEHGPGEHGPRDHLGAERWPGPGDPGRTGATWPGSVQGPDPVSGPGRPPGNPATPGPFGGPSGQSPGNPTPPGAGAGAGGPGGPGFGGAWASGGGWSWGHPGGWGPPPGGGYPARQNRKWLAAAMSGVVAAGAVLIGVGIGYGVWNGGSVPAASRSRFVPRVHTTSLTSGTTSGKTSNASGAPSNSATIAKSVDPGLVDINTVLGYETEEAAGTGMVLTSTGKVLTNNHVIEGSTSISVTDLGNSRTYQATVLGYSRTNDVALIQLKGASGLQTVSLGSSSSLKVGESVVGIGNAGGVGGTPSVAGGSITALNQAITASDQGSLGTTTEHLTGLIQSDCDIQPGDSGGPLVDSSGKVVGMDTAASQAQGYSINAATGQGYSIPINTALGIVRQIEAGKSATSVHIGGTAFLGVYVEPVSGATGSSGTGLGARTPTVTPTTGKSVGSGALVAGVIPGTPARSSGLTVGDVITSIGGHSVSSVDDVTKIVLGYHPGQSVKVTWTTTSGATQSATITLASGPAE